MADSTSSLLQRIQARLTNNKENQIVFEDSENENENESESDIDDDITLDECIRVVKRKSQDRNSSFTKIMHPQSSSSTNLKELVSKKMADRHNKVSNNNVQQTSSVPSIDTTGIQGIKTIYNSVESQPNSMDSDLQTYENSMESQSQGSQNSMESQSQTDGDSQVTVKKKRSKLTDEEKKRREEERLEKKRKQQKEKLERQKKREEEKLARELAKEKEKAVKKAATLSKRSERKDECLEKIVAIVDPSIIEGKNGADILKGLQDIGVRYEIKSLPIPSCIGWLKENSTFSVNDKSEVSKSVTFEEESHVLHKMEAAELAVRVSNEMTGEDETFTMLIKEMKTAFHNKNITFILTGLDAYYRSIKTKQNRQFRAQALGFDEQADKRKRKKDQAIPTLQKDEIELMLVQVQTLNDGVFMRKCEDMAKVSEFVASFTRSIAEAPFKKVSNASLQFCAIAPNDKQSIKVLDDGTGILPLWNQQLQQFYGVRHETSIAITQHYPTPRSLMEAYQKERPDNAPFLLQDIEIRRGVGVLQTSRRVGPELSKRVHKLMTSTNGEEQLAK